MLLHPELPAQPSSTACMDVKLDVIGSICFQLSVPLHVVLLELELEFM